MSTAVCHFEVPADAPAVRPSGLPFFVFCVYTFILIGRPQDHFPQLVPLRLALVFTFVAAVVTLFSRASGERPIRWHRQTTFYLALAAIMCAGVPFSVYPKVSFEFIALGYLVNVVFYVLFLTHVTTVGRFRRIVLVLMISALMFAAFGIMRGEQLDGRYTTGSETFDPNDVAFVELSLLPFCIAALLGPAGVVVRLLALSSVAAGVLLTLYTGSRGGFLGLATLFLLFVLVRVAGVRKVHKMAMFLVIAGIATAGAANINTDRYRTLASLEDDYNMSDEYGRAQVWARGLRLFTQNPITGVGVMGFGESIAALRERESLPPRWQAAHSSYVEILAETGAPGAAAFLGMILTSILTLNRLRRGTASDGGEIARIAGVLLVGFMGQLVAAAFLSQGYSVLLALSIAATAALKTIAGGTEPSHAGA